MKGFRKHQIRPIKSSKVPPFCILVNILFSIHIRTCCFCKKWSAQNYVSFGLWYVAIWKTLFFPMGCYNLHYEFWPKNYYFKGYSLGIPVDFDMHMSVALFAKFQILLRIWTIPTLMASNIRVIIITFRWPPYLISRA